MKTVFRSCLPLFALAMVLPAAASWIAPPEVEWIPAPGSAFEMKRENRKGVLTVYKKDDRETPQWSATLTGFHELFSRTHLTAPGDLIIHVRDNHIVRNLDETAVEIVRRDGASLRLPAGDFIDALLPPPQPMVSTDAMQRWMQKVEVSDTTITVHNARGEKKELSLDDLRKKLEAENAPTAPKP